MTDNAPLFKALVNFQRSVTNVAKDQTAKVQSAKGSFSYTYTDIAGVIEAIRVPLAEHGLCHMQILTNVEGRPAIRTILAHEEGGSIEGTVTLQGDLNDPQKFGGICTYYRRYGLLGVLGLATEDDDANHARTPTPQDRGSTRQQVTDATNRYQQDQSPVRPPQTQGGASQGSDEDMDWTDLWQLLRPLGYANKHQLEAFLGFSITDMSPAQVFGEYKRVSIAGSGQQQPAQNGSRPQYPASEKQINYIRSLLPKKGLDEKAWTAWSMFLLDTDQEIPVDSLDKTQAKQVLDALLEMPDNPQMAAILEASGR